MKAEAAESIGRRPWLSRLAWSTGILLTVALLAAAPAPLVLTVRRQALQEFPEATGWPAGETAASLSPGLLLPDVAGLAGQGVAGAEAVKLFGTQIPQVTVNIDRSGNAVVGGTANVSPWRGVDLPAYTYSAGSAESVEVLLMMSLHQDRVNFRLQEWTTSSIHDLRGTLGKLSPAFRNTTVLPIIAPEPDVPFGHVAGAIAILLDLGWEPDFLSSPRESAPSQSNARTWTQLQTLAGMLPAPDGLSSLGVRIRADSRAPWSAVRDAITACAQADVWRVSFACITDGHEGVIGRTRHGVLPRSRRVKTEPEFLDGDEGEYALRDLPVKPIEDIPLAGDPGPAPDESEGMPSLPPAPLASRR